MEKYSSVKEPLVSGFLMPGNYIKIVVFRRFFVQFFRAKNLFVLLLFILLLFCFVFPLDIDSSSNF